VGLDNIDSQACQRHGVEVLSSPGINRRSVAELTLGFMIYLLRNLYPASNDLKNGFWNRTAGRQLTGKKVGIIGVGHIGKELVELLNPFDCDVYVNDIIDQNEYYRKNNLTESTKEYIYENCDMVSIHTPLTRLTEHLINNKSLGRMKPNAFLINTARGAIVDQDALKQALKQGVIAGAALDVFEVEPPDDPEFLSLPNLIVTPHLGGHSQEAIIRMGLSAIQNLLDFVQKQN
jgi:D-3-phosphoglycerate dehydrogenase